MINIVSLFGKSKQPDPFDELGVPPINMRTPQQMVPANDVINLKRQGLAPHQINQYLGQQGFTPTEINDAFNMAEIKGAVEAPISGGPLNMQNMQNTQVRPQQNQNVNNNMNNMPQGLPVPPQGMGFPGTGQMPLPPQFSPEMISQDERIEELAEAIIDEKWKELTKNIDKIIDWKEKTESKINIIQQEFADIKKNFESLHDAILGKVSEYDQNIISLGSEIKAMEKVFQKLLPTFTENVNELARITKTMKK